MQALARAAIMSGALTKLGPLTTIAGTGLTMGVTHGFLPMPIRAIALGKTVMNQTGLSNQTGRAVSRMNPPPMAYGKRGLDSNRLSTSGLVQSLHKGRRTS